MLIGALAAGNVALGTWWSSLVLARSAATLNTKTEASLAHSIGAQLDKLAPGTSQQPQVQQAISTALHDPAVTAAFARSAESGSQVLSQQLAQLDAPLAQVLHGQTLLLTTGQHALAANATTLRRVARFAAMLAGALAIGAFVISARRYALLRHLGVITAAIGGLGLLFSWGVPQLLHRYTSGQLRHVALNILTAGLPVRHNLIEIAGIGAGAVALSFVWESVRAGAKTASHARRIL